jgi:hypothetical protein
MQQMFLTFRPPVVEFPPSIMSASAASQQKGGSTEERGRERVRARVKWPRSAWQHDALNKAKSGTWGSLDRHYADGTGIFTENSSPHVVSNAALDWVQRCKKAKTRACAWEMGMDGEMAERTGVATGEEREENHRQKTASRTTHICPAVVARQRGHPRSQER